MDYEFDRNDFRKGLKLGEGAFGAVFRWDKVDPEDETVELPDPVAIKEVKEDEQYSRRELNLLGALDHPNIVRYFCHFELSWKTLGIVLELCQGSLTDLLNPRGLTLHEVSMLMKQLLTGLDYLHGQNYIHRDIKPANILLSGPSSDTEWATVDVSELTLKLSDFGLSRSFDKMRQEGSTLTVVGTLDFMAPEIKEPYVKKERGAVYNEKADVWSAGMSAYFCAKGRLPALPDYRTDEIAEDEELQANGFASFLLSHLHRQPEDRASPAELLMHEFVV